MIIMIGVIIVAHHNVLSFHYHFTHIQLHTPSTIWYCLCMRLKFSHYRKIYSSKMNSLAVNLDIAFPPNVIWAVFSQELEIFHTKHSLPQQTHTVSQFYGCTYVHTSCPYEEALKFCCNTLKMSLSVIIFMWGCNCNGVCYWVCDQVSFWVKICTHTHINIQKSGAYSPLCLTLTEGFVPLMAKNGALPHNTHIYIHTHTH